MEGTIRNITEYVGYGIEFLALIIVGIAIIKAVYQYFKSILFSKDECVPKNEIRLTLGRSLVLALEFLLAADIVQTAIAPSWEDIGKLAAIIAIRTVLNYFLNKEIEK